MRIAEKTARILLTVIGFFGLAVFFLPKIGISVDIVMSGSMEPTLKTGGIVFTDTKRTEPSVGDIVTFRNAQGKVSHRVVAKQKQSYVTKGDANNMEDHSLGVFKSKASGELKFSLEIPKEWDNAWALKKTDVSWIFSVQDETSEMDTTEEQSENEDQSFSGDSFQSSVKDTGSKQKSSVKTGDPMPVELMLLLFLVAGISIPVIKKWKGAKKS